MTEMFLLDTMVVSETGKRLPHPVVTAWVDAKPRRKLYVSVVSFGEIAVGIANRRIAPEYAAHLEDWSERARRLFLERTLPVTTGIALRWGALAATLGRRDLDLFIAATALEHDLTVVTRNVRHFAPTGAKLFNPYEA